MKMVTKTFEKAADDDLPWVRFMIGNQMRPWHGCTIDEVHTAVYHNLIKSPRCFTPPKLWDAICNKKAITFSVTLPAKYWKKEIA